MSDIINEMANRRLIWATMWFASRKQGLMMKTTIGGDPTENSR